MEENRTKVEEDEEKNIFCRVGGWTQLNGTKTTHAIANTRNFPPEISGGMSSKNRSVRC